MNAELNINLIALAATDFRCPPDRIKERLTAKLLLQFHHSPWLYRKNADNLIDESPPDMVNEAAHVRILRGLGVYREQFGLNGTYPVLDPYQIDLVEQLSAGVAMNDDAVELLLYGRADIGLWTEYVGTMCHSHPDWVHPNKGIVDLRICDDLTWFAADARRQKMAHQWAFDQTVLAQVLDGNPRVPVYVIAVEKKEPFRCGAWRVGEDTLSLARTENEHALRRLLTCREQDNWPTGCEGLRTLELI